MRRVLAWGALMSLSLAACANGDQAPEDAPTSPVPPASANPSDPPSASPSASPAESPSESPQSEEPSPDVAPVREFRTTEHGKFTEPWAMEFLPGTDLLLINERGGAMKLRDQSTGEVREVSGVPEVYHEGQAGLHDVKPAPSFETDGRIYVSWVTRGDEGPHGMLGLGTLDIANAALEDLDVIWEQDPAGGDGHFSLRIAIADDLLYLTSGDRQEMDPAQDNGTNLGKILRLSLDGTPAPDNPFGDEGVESSFWSIGHRNPLGLDFDVDGTLWSSEMGPEGGDELNRIVPGANYGWPEASNGSHYNGRDIPDHREGDGFEAPKAFWTPSISPGNLEIYEGDLFAGWRNSALLGGLSGETLVRVALDGENADIVDEWEMGERVRAVEEAPDGSIWLLEDGAGARLLELRPA
ncbi:PQQ-dependent sugar dehydrogenase [Tessaracoccus oleiagri]|nr:PQQ-dependent sugar dehydrogenase [Tessaracoccus oleiagri]